MNLNDLYEGREPYQQAIDRLEQRRIEDLEAKMDDLAARAKESTDPKVKEALRHEFAKAKAERDSYYTVNEAPGAETLQHNQNTVASNEKALGLEEVVDTNYTYTVYIDGNKEGTYGSQEEARAVVRRKKEQAPGRDYRIKPKARTSMASVKRFQRNRDRNLDESLKVSPHDAGAFAALKGKPYSSNPYPAGTKEHLEWSKGHNAFRAHKAELDEHGGGGGGPAQWHAYVRSHRANESVMNEGDQIDPIILKALDRIKPGIKGMGGPGTELYTAAKEALALEYGLIQARNNSPFVHYLNKLQDLYIQRRGVNEHGGGVNGMKNYIAWRKKANTERGITKAPPPVGKPASSKVPRIPKGTVHGKLDQSRGVVPVAKFNEESMEEWKNSAPGETDQDELIKVEGWSNKMVARRTGQAPTPYSVYINGKEWKSFADDDHAENVANKLRAKFKQEGKDPSVITIAPSGLKEDIGSWIVYDPKTKQIKKKFKTHTAGKSYAKAHGLGFASSEYYFDNVKQPVDENQIGANPASRYATGSGSDKNTIATLLAPGFKEGGGNFNYMVQVKCPTMDTLRSKYHDDLEAMFADADSKELAQAARELKALYGKEVDEGWSINPSHQRGPRSMKSAAKKPTGPKFSGYLKGTDPAPNEYTNKGVGGCEESEEMDEGIAGNMTSRSNPLTQPLRTVKHINKRTQPSLGKFNNNLKAAAARSKVKSVAKPIGLNEITDEEGAKLRKDAEEYAIKQMTAPKKQEPKKSFLSKVGQKQIDMVKGAYRGLTGKLEESDNFLTWAVRNGYNITKPAVYESAKQEYNSLKEDCGPIAPHETYYGAMDEAKKLGNRVKIVSGSAAGQTGTIGEIRPGAFKGAPGYYTVDLDNGSHIQVRKEALRLIKVGELDESLKQGEYFVWTVYFDDGTSKRIKVTSDEFDPYSYYAKKNKVVVNVDYDWSIHEQ